MDFLENELVIASSLLKELPFYGELDYIGAIKPVYSEEELEDLKHQLLCQ